MNYDGDLNTGYLSGVRLSTFGKKSEGDLDTGRLVFGTNNEDLNTGRLAFGTGTQNHGGDLNNGCLMFGSIISLTRTKIFISLPIHVTPCDSSYMLQTENK